MPKLEIKVGQVYADKDKRYKNRYLRVLWIGIGESDLCECTAEGQINIGGTTMVSHDNLRRRFRLVKDLEAVSI
jgi:hypothetical protein